MESSKCWCKPSGMNTDIKFILSLSEGIVENRAISTQTQALFQVSLYSKVAIFLQHIRGWISWVSAARLAARRQLSQD